MSQTASTRQHYYVPQPMPWPIMGSTALFLMALGAVFVFNGSRGGWFSIGLGFLILLYMLFRWFGSVIRESEGGKYGGWEDASFRWGMSWFIFSEVMFFSAFFGADFYARQFSVPWLGGEGAKAVTSLLWPDFTPGWPSNGPGDLGPRDDGSYEIIPAFGLPALNTALLLTSGLTITIAHHALLAGQRVKTIFWMWITVALGITFISFQAYEYIHAYSELNLKLSSGIYGSTFFMLTGFHGFHVFVGMLMLTFITLRLMKGHFTPQRHFGFEGAAWYWHFVDVVWLGLYFLVYWL